MQQNDPLLKPLRDLVRSAAVADTNGLGIQFDPEDPFLLMVNGLSDSLTIMDPDGVILFANPAWCEMHSVKLEDVLGQPVVEFSVTKDKAEFTERRMNLLRTLSPDDPRVDLVFSLQNGGYAEVTYRGWFNDDGELLAVYGYGRDRSEFYSYEAELEDANVALGEANAALAESNRDLQDFAHIASHDLQEPLRKISAFSERLGDRYADQLDDRGQDYLSRISAASGRMQQLINSLLDYSRVNSRGAELKGVDLNSVVATVLTDLEVAIEESEAEISVAELPRIECDAVQVHQLFQNLTGNALKFRRDGVPPTISLTSATDDAGHTITVSDNGIGFEQEFADKIFAPFQRLHARSDYAGSGIGLAVCRRIVERHGGSISARSVIGEGATFTITFPLAAPNRPGRAGG